MRALLDSAIALHQQGRFAEAAGLYARVLDSEPGNFTALHLLGLALHSQGRSGEGLAWIERALAVDPASADALANRGVVLEAMGRAAEALESQDRALAIRPTADSWNNRGNILRRLGREAEALASYDAALALAPGHADAWNNRGNALRSLGRRADALASFERAIALSPGHAAAWNNRGALLLDAHRTGEALACFERALSSDGAHADAWSNRGLALRQLARLPDALASFDRALAANPAHADALYFRGFTHQDLKQPGQALRDFERALARGHPYALGGLANTALHLCDWPKVEALARRIESDQTSVLPPLLLLGLFDDPALHRRGAARFLHDRLAQMPPPLWTGEVYRHEKIRIAYLSGDFHEHATAYLIAELFERHDRGRFEVIGLSHGPDDGSATRARLVRGFDKFLDVRSRSDAEAARLLRGLEVDIAIDLKGHTRDARTEILAFRPAPVQAQYLGYPGTMAAPFIDYVIADAMALPLDQQGFYDEKIVHLPGSYQPNDSRRAIAQETLSRQDAGLPVQGFVFCCFNAGWKITRPVFDIWMRLLAAVPGSVLWLLEDSPEAQANLKREAAVRRVDPARLVFAPRMALPAHLARHRLADLFVDTLPYNAHTTASDALWSGLPVLTRRGTGFAARVAASLLAAAGLPELITDTAEAYESLALNLARDPVLLGSYRQRLAQTRATAPLFDSARLARHLEAAYVRMTGRARSGAAPEGFSV
jgi:predicted O-linked N-acetylglucosamine transferase (SPINDLY family)